MHSKVSNYFPPDMSFTKEKETSQCSDSGVDSGVLAIIRKVMTEYIVLRISNSKMSLIT